MKRIILLLIAVFFISGISAQSKTGYYILPEAALLNGDNHVSGQALLTAGIKKKEWMFGIGAAVDYYKIRTVPLFADLRYRFGKDLSLFSYADLGTNFIWPLETQYMDHREPNATVRNSYSNGLYTDIGIGYSFHDKKQKGWQISIGYTMKTVKATYTEGVFRDFPPYGYDYFERKLDYTLNRISLRFGVEL